MDCIVQGVANSQTQLRSFHARGAGGLAGENLLLFQPFMDTVDLCGLMKEEGLLIESQCSVNFGLCILSLTFPETENGSSNNLFDTYPRGKSLLHIPHLCGVQSSLRFWPDNSFHDFRMIYKIYCIICQVKYIEFISSEANSNTQPYYKKLIFAPGIFHGASVSWALGRNTYLEKILRFKSYGVSKTYLIHHSFGH